MCDAFDVLSREKVMSYSSFSSKRRVPKMKHTTTLLWLFSLSKTTTRCMRAKARLLFYSSVRLVVAMTRVSRLRVETCLSFVVVVRLLYSGLLFVLFVVCVCCVLKKKKNNFTTTTPFFVFCFFFGKISFLTSSKNFTFFIDDFLSGQVFRYSSVWCQIKLYLSTRTNCTKSRLHC